MWSKYKPLVSLYEWAQVIGINPYLVAQIGLPSSLLSTEFGQCENVFYQTSNQRADHLSRDDLALALLQAENLIARYLKTPVAPKQIQEPLLYPRPANLSYAQLFTGASRRVKPIELEYGNVQSMGVYEETLLDDNVAITASDPYSDGFNTRFSATVAVPSGTLASELKVYFSSGDRVGLTLSESEIRPVSVSISGLVATITGSITLLVKPANYLKQVPTNLTVTDSLYATTFDVYRQTVDISQSGAMLWDNFPCYNPPCSYTVNTACFYLTDAGHGYVTPIPASYDEATAQFVASYPNCKAYAPDRVQANYIAGVPRDADGLVNFTFRQATAYLATALLSQSKSCGCNQADTVLYYYRSLPTQGENENLEVSNELLGQVSQAFGNNNRGAIRAYIALQQHPFRVHRSVAW